MKWFIIVYKWKYTNSIGLQTDLFEEAIVEEELPNYSEFFLYNDF